jgi:hypothetical protein
MEVGMRKESLNLSIDGVVIERARRYSRRHGTSLSHLVTTYLAALPTEDDTGEDDLPPVVRRLYGAAKGGGDVDDYHRYLIEKYER